MPTDRAVATDRLFASEQGRSSVIDEGTTGAVALKAVAARPSLRDEAISTLQAAIISGELRPGRIYSAPALAAELGMSATPVREAMLALVKDGLIETVRNKGFRVVQIDDRELDDLTDIRLMIEIPAIRRLAKRGLDAADDRRLRALARQIEQAAQRGDMVAHNRLDLEFHSALLAVLGNRTLVDLARALRVRSRLYGMAELPVDVLLPTSHEHAKLLDLIHARDPAAAAALMRTHIGHVRREWA